MANNNNKNDKDVIYNSERDRHVTHTADNTNRVAGDRVKETTTTRETRHVAHEEPKKKSPWPWLIPLLLLLLAIPFLMNMCNNEEKDTKEETTTEETTTEKATTEEATTEEVTTEAATTEEANAGGFDLASIVNFDLAA
ncbi:hypothetical protein ERX37_01505 [Macrococcus hajekii]|uniref:Uncharacterized protein n=1 Tax=Macrococcus hajekii TaxID=198482 RepID=A0A4R6BMB4_9STAP|nr:hypothetical protein [Macrococcus hajekii]TDM02792.1 hypothetical protein ERX37_01505 [Macrococcus hajekii]GGB03918.1 hypothetical protein GCM10007190_09940 [Macrococcus hajekii]